MSSSSSTMHRTRTYATMWLYVLLLLILTLLGYSTPATARRIVAIGDLHGDYNQSRAILHLTRLIDSHNNWIGEDSYLVQLGDILDVGPDDLKIVKLLMKVQKQAKAKNGDVVQLLGNHEIRNLAGDYKAVDPASLAATGGAAGRDTLLSNRTDFGMYLRTRKAVFHYGPFLFMHGGISTATSNMITSLDKVDKFNAELSDALVNGTISPLARGGLDLNEDEVDNVGNPILVRSIRNVKCKDLTRVLDKKFPGIQSIVVGHVPHNPLSFDDWRLCGGRLIDVDFGMSRWKQGNPGHVAALEIEEGTWHVQLIESTIDFPNEVTHSMLTNWFYHSSTFFVFFLISILLTMILIAVVVMIFCRHAHQPSILSGHDKVYGTL